MNRRAGAVVRAALSVSLCHILRGQTPVILTIDTENVVEYQADSPDVAKWATNPNITPGAPIRNFTAATPLGDIAAVNGQSAKGLYASRVASIITSPTPDSTLGGAIADTQHPSIRQQIFEILKTDGTPIGTIVGLGMSGGSTPGSPALVRNGDWAIVGGTGAFLGVRGQMGRGAQTVPARAASVIEDPGNRRINGGGKLQWVLTLLPMFTPQIVATADGPAVTHSADFTLVSTSKPAAAGETLSIFMTGLGPTQPGVDPGKPFPTSPLQVVNSLSGRDRWVPGEFQAACGRKGHHYYTSQCSLDSRQHRNHPSPMKLHIQSLYWLLLSGAERH